MLNNKCLLIALILCVTQTTVLAESLSDVTHPKAPAYRVGISELPETQYVQAKQDKTALEKTYARLEDSKDSNTADITYADLSIKQLSKEVAQELEYDEQDMVADLSLLWQGAAMQSDTINFALYKLANPDADKPDAKSVKNVLKTIASMSTLVGASMGSPLLAGSSLIGGNILGIMTQDTKALNYKYTKVTDADMIILIRKIEDLQQNAVNLYYDYMSAKKQLELATKLVEERQHKFELAQQNNAPRELIVITDAYYRTAIDKQRTAKSDFFSKRAALEQFVGNETFVQFETDLAARENGEKTAATTNTNQKYEYEEPTYANTIQTVENYTNSLNNSVENNDTYTANTSYEYEDEEDDANLSKVPQVNPFDYESDNRLTSETQAKTDLAGSTRDNKSTKTGFLKRNKKTESSELNLAETQNSTKDKTTKKTKADRYSTKGFIFLHDNTKEEAVKNSKKGSPSETLEPLEQTTVNSSKNSDLDLKNLLPLDEIKAPALDGKGYSIHSDYDGDFVY